MPHPRADNTGVPKRGIGISGIEVQCSLSYCACAKRDTKMSTWSLLQNKKFRNTETLRTNSVNQNLSSQANSCLVRLEIRHLLRNTAHYLDCNSPPPNPILSQHISSYLISETHVLILPSLLSLGLSVYPFPSVSTTNTLHAFRILSS